MKKKIVWLVVTGGMVAALLLASCAPAAVKEEAEKVAPPKEQEEVVVPKEVAPEKKADFIRWTAKKQDGTVVEKMIEKPKYGGTLVYAQDTEPTRWGGIRWGGAGVQNLGPVVDTAVTVSLTRGPVGTEEWGGFFGIPAPYYTYVGSLAESWELPDDSTIIYHLRKGVHWGLEPTKEASKLVGGRQMTSDDWLYFFRRGYTLPNHLARNYPFLSDMKNPEKSIYVDPDDPWAVVFKFKPGLSANHFVFGGAFHGYIQPPEVIEKFGQGPDKEIIDWRHLVATGPFLLTDYVPASSMTYVRNPDYWDNRDPFFPENRLPYVDTFKVLIIPDLSTTMAGLRTGKIDMREGLKAEDTESLMKTNPELKWKSYVHNPFAIYPRVDKPELPWYDVRVRRALMMAINYKEIVDDYHEGKAELFTYPIIPGPDFADMYIPLEKLPQSVQELYAYKPDKAKQLLAEAGYPNGFKAEALAWSSEQIDLLSIVKEYWAKIGVDLKIDVRAQTVYTSMLLLKTHTQMAIATPNLADWPVMPSFRPKMPWNYAMITEAQDPVIIPYFEEVMRRFYEPARMRALPRTPLSEALPNITEAKGLPNWITYANERAFFFALPNPYVYVVWQPWLKHFEGGFSMTPYFGYSYARYAWIDQALKTAMGR